ncbi:MAG: hypothetical protein JSR72_05090 [Proteobacteria bacterium]|nr:hypothetical protein [Pseudomonadota bacterium]
MATAVGFAARVLRATFAVFEAPRRDAFFGAALAFFVTFFVTFLTAFAAGAFFLAARAFPSARVRLRFRPAFLALVLALVLAVRFADRFFAFAIMSAGGQGFRKASLSRAWYMPRDRHD